MALFKRFDYVWDELGNALPGVTVRLELPDETPITIYLDKDGNFPVGFVTTALLTDPFPGHYEFFAEPGEVVFVIDTGLTIRKIPQFLLPGPGSGVGVGDGGLVSVGTTNTLAPGSLATVTNSGTPPDVVLNFGIPRGFDGLSPTLEVGTVTTVGPSTPASAEIVGASPDLVLNLTIPRGADGANTALAQTSEKLESRHENLAGGVGFVNVPTGLFEFAFTREIDVFLNGDYQDEFTVPQPNRVAWPAGSSSELGDDLVIVKRSGARGADGLTPSFSGGAVTTLAPGSAATGSVTGTAPNFLINLGLPRGADGPPNTLAIGTVASLAAGSPAAASITGAAPNQTLNLGIPRGSNGTSPTVNIGDVDTLAPGSAATVDNSGSPTAVVLNFGIPAGEEGDPGPPNELTIGTVESLASNANATAAITGNAPDQVLSLGIPRGQNGPPNTLSIGTVDTLSGGSPATANITGAAPTQTLNLGIPAGINGTGLPAGGTAGQQLEKVSAGNNDTAWATRYHVPAGGATGDVLTKSSGADGAAAFAAPHYIPVGGAAGQVLRKVDGTDYNATWQDPMVAADITTPARALNTNFQPSATRPTLCIYVVEIDCDDAETGDVNLLTDAATPPVTLACPGHHDFSVSGVLGVTGGSSVYVTLMAVVMPGHNVRLSTSGTAAFTMRLARETKL